MSSTPIGSSSQVSYQAPPPAQPPNNAANADLGVNPPAQATQLPQPQPAQTPPAPAPGLGQNVDITV